APGGATGEYGAPGQTTGGHRAPDRPTGGYGTPDRPTGQNPAAATNPIANPYGTGTSASPVKRRAYIVPYAVSAVFTLGMAGTIMYVSHTFGGGPSANNAASSRGTDGPDTAGNSVPALSAPGAGQDSTIGGGPTATDATSGAKTVTTGKSLLTPANARAVIASAAKASGSAKFVEITIYDDGHAIFDIVKKDDPGAYDSWIYHDGKTDLWTKGDALDGKKTFDADKINWDALPAVIKDGQSTLKVKNPTLSYIIANADADDTPNGLQMEYYLTSDYYSGFLHCDSTGKIIERYPQK
ncbi:MAG: hypothetical protein HOW97_07045, partial [Catenulispora sp.]|nr:hypothetical protein [Catenulispora sp.]